MVVALIGAGIAAGVGATAATVVLVGAGAGAVALATGVESEVQDFIVGEIIEPVANAIGDTIKYIADNPLEAVVTLGTTIFAPYAAPLLGTTTAALTSAAAWAIPLANGGQTLLDGGSFEDALKDAALSYVAQSVGGTISDFASSQTTRAITNTLGDTATTNAVANVLGAGGKAAATAVVYGQNPVDAFKAGSLNAAVSATLGYVDNQIAELTDGQSGWSDLQDGIKNTIYSGIAAEVTNTDFNALDAVTALDSDGYVSKVIDKYSNLGTWMSDFAKANTRLTDAELSLIGDAVGRAATIALDGNPNLSGEEFFGALQEPAYEEFKDLINDPIENALDKLSGTFSDVEDAAASYNEKLLAAEGHATTINTANARVEAILGGQNDLIAQYNAALEIFNGNKTQANADVVNGLVEQIDTYGTNNKAELDNLTKTIEDTRVLYDNAVAALPDLQAEYNRQAEFLITDTEDFSSEITPVLSGAEKAVALSLRPGFDADAYREAAGLGPDENVYSHYLAQGQNLPTDRVSVNQTLNSARGQLIRSAMANQGVDFFSLEPEQQEAVAQHVINNVKSLNDITGIDFDAFSAAALQAAEDATPRGAVLPESFERAAGVTDTDIANGNAVLELNGDTYEWQLAGNIQNNFGDASVSISQNSDGSLSALMNTALTDGGTATAGGITVNFPNYTGSTADSSSTLRDIVQGSIDGVYDLGVVYVNQINELNETAGRLLDEYVGEPIWEATTSLYNEYVKDTTTGNALQNTASIVAGASGELLQAASGLALLAGANPNNAVGRLADKLLNAGENLRTEGYQASVDEINDTIGNAEGWREKARAIWDVATDGDTAGVFFAEYVGKELLQEIPVLLASAGAGNVAKRALQTAGEQAAKNYAARVGVSTAIGIDMAEAFGGTAAGAYDEAYATALKTGMSSEEANDYAIEVGQKAGAIATLMVGVTAGVGGAAFEKAILGDGAQDVAMRNMYDAFRDRLIEGGTVTIKEGVTESIEEALPQAYVAMSLAQIDPTYDVSGEIMAAALLGKIAGAGTAGGIYTGNAVADALYSSSSEVQNAVNNAGSAQAAETALKGLGINDNLVLNNLLNTSYDQFYVSTGEAEASFKKANPNFEVDQSTVEAFVGKANEAQTENAIEQYVDNRYLDRDEVKAIAASEGISLTDAEADVFVQQGTPGQLATIQNVIRSDADSDYVTAEEARARFESLGFTPSNSQVNNFVGKFREATRLNQINSYVDPRQVTEAEARSFFDALGYTPTDAEVQNYMGQGGANFESTAPARVESYVDPRQVTEAEAKQFFSDLGYTPTDEEVADFVAQVSETTQQSEVEKYVDPRFVTLDEVQAIADAEGLTLTETLAATYLGQKDEASTLETARGEFDPLATTYDEAKQFFGDLGYTPSYDEVASFVASATEEAQKSGVVEYVDPRQVTLAESRDFLEGLGYTPTDAEVERFVGQVNEAQQETAIEEYVDPRLVSEDEVVAAYAELGLARPTDADVQELMGQYMETELAGKAEENLPTARYNSIISILDDFTGEAGVSEEMQEALDIVKGDMINALGDLGLEVAAIDQATQNLEDAVGTIASEGGDATGLYGYIDAAVETLTNAGLTAEEVETTITDIVGTPATGDADATGLYSELADLGTDIDTTNELLGTPATDDADATGLYGYIDTAVDSLGADLGSLIGTVGTPAVVDADGNVVEEATGIFAQLSDLEAAGLSRDEAIAQLSDDLGVAVTDLTEEITTVEESLSGDIAGVSEDVGTLAGVLGTPEIFDDPSTEVDEGRDPTGLFGVIKQYETAGMERDEAIQEALGDLSTELGLTEKNILDELGLTEIALGEQIDASEAALTEEIGDVETTLTTRIDELEEAGIERDEALQTALGELATDLGTTEENILAQIGTTEENLLAEIGGVQTTLEETAAATGADLDFISNLVGKPARDVTQTDVDFVADLVAQQQVLDELSLEYQQYDVTGDGILDINDQTLLEQSLAGEQVQLAPESAFVTDPTGVYGALYDTQQDIQTQMEQDKQQQLDAIQDMNTQLNTQMQANQQMSNMSDFRNLLMQQQDISGQRVDVRTPDPMRINYLYDFSSIFANPSQSSLFPSPYAEGGQVEDTTDKLLRIIGGTS